MTYTRDHIVIYIKANIHRNRIGQGGACSIDIWHINTESILPIWSPESFVEFFIHEAADIEDDETVGIKKCMEDLKSQIKEHIYDCIEKLHSGKKIRLCSAWRNSYNF